MFASQGYSNETVPNIPNYLVQAVLLTITCFVLSFFAFFFPILGVLTGIIAIVYATQVNSKVAGRNYVGAEEASRNARIWTIITFAFVILEVVIIAILILLFVLAIAGAAAGA